MPPPAAVGVAPRHDGGRLRRPASIPAPAAAGDVVARLPGARRGDLPRFVTPQLATLVSSPPAGDEWLHEMKFDGYRILSRIEGGQARLLSRNGKDWTAQFPAVAAATAQLPVRQALLDGEVAVLRPDGTTSFNALQNVLEAGGGGELVYYVFDLLHQDGVDLREVPLESRKAALATLLGSGTGAVVRQSDHVVGGGAAFFRAACELGLEGMVSKRRDAAYVSGRGRTWLKVKCVNEQEFIVGGFTEPEGARVGIGALLLGVHEEDERLRYVGKVGTGFSAAAARALRKQLDGLVQERCPFSERPSGVGQPQWVRPVLVAQVMFTEWTPDGRLRHPSFKGFREDADPRQIVREEPAPLRGESVGKGSAMPATNEDGRNSRSPSRAVTKGARSPREARRRRPAVVNRPAGPPSARPAGIRRSGASRVAARSKASPRVRNGAEAEIAGVAITHPNRVVYPAQSITKLALARYYESIAEWILPHIRGRPTSLVRCPEGLQKACFYQKHVSGWAPEPLRRVRIREKHKVGEYLVVEDLPGLIGLVQMGILEIHTWNAVVDHLEQPDRLVIDLDPDEAVPWSEVIAAARLVREEFARFGLESFVKTTGGKGLHVVVPIEPKLGWEDVAGFARSLAVEMARQDPGRFVITMSKAARKGKIFIDYMRNLRGATSIAPYSTRARPGAPVSTPLAWDELDQKLRSDHFTVGNLRRRLAGWKVDPWKRYWMLRQQLRQAPPTASGRRRPGR
jgi:bifunctional non-homologous end joining protein LigD